VLNNGGYEMAEGNSTEFNTSQESAADILIWDNVYFRHPNLLKQSQLQKSER
jgi:hypothetical protein